MEKLRWSGSLHFGMSDLRRLLFPSLTISQGKDCLNLLHLYLTKREIETRRVKSRSFAGVDIHELDLINPPPPKTPSPKPTDPAATQA